MDIAARSDANNAEVITWYWTNRENQYWEILPVDCESTEINITSNELETRALPTQEMKDKISIYPNPTRDYSNQ